MKKATITTPEPQESAEAVQAPSATGAILRSDHKSLYTQLLSGLYDAVLITDPNGYVIDTNPRVEEFFQFKGSEVWDEMIGELISGVDLPLLARVRKGLEQGRLIMLDAKCVRKDGTTFPGEVSISTIRAVNEGDLVFAVRNVERRKSAWKKMRSEQNGWLVSLAPGVIVDHDGVICGVNRAAVELWQRKGETEFTGKYFKDLWENGAEAEEALALTVKEKSWRGKLAALLDDCQTVPVEVSLESDASDRGSAGGFLCSLLPSGGDGN